MGDNDNSYQVICIAYYCGWESEIFSSLEEAENVEKCPRCGAGQAQLNVEVC